MFNRISTERCPTPDELDRFHAEGSSAGGEASLAEHVASCARCRKWLAAADGDDRLLSDLRRALEPGDLQCAPSPPNSSAVALANSPFTSRTAVPAAPPGYRILAKVGEGGMGVVYEAEQERPRRRVALKMIRTSALSVTTLRRFTQEANVLAMLQHPGVASIFEVGSVDGPDSPQPFFAMEFIAGGPLLEHAAEHRLSTRDRMKLLTAICDAVQHAHQKGIIHRDLKPGNILVTESGQPKVLDFGVARLVGLESPALTLHTEAGQLVGTLAYMSPEQVAGDPAAVDTRTDVYSLGVIGFELLTGRMPYGVKGAALVEAIRVIRETEAARLGQVDRFLRGDVESIFLKALEKDAERRYQSAGELAADIRRLLADEPIVARAPSTTYRLRKFAKRNKVLVIGAAATFLALTVGLALTSWQAVRASRAEAKAKARFEDVRKLVNAVIFDMHDAIRDLPRSTSALKLLVERAIEYLDRLAVDARDNPELQAELASAYERLARTQGSQLNRNLGDPQGALATCQKALPLREALLAQHPDDLSRILDLATLRGEMGNTMFVHDPDQAVAYYRTSCDLSRPICDRSLHAQRIFAWYALRMVWCLSRDNRIAEAGAIAQESAHVFDSVPEPPAQTPDEIYALCDSYQAMGTALIKGGHPRDSLRYFDRVLALSETLALAGHKTCDFALLAPNALRYRAQAEFLSGDYAAAVATAEQCLAGFEAVLIQFPESFPTSHVRALVRLELAESYGKLSQLAPALEHGRKGLAILEQVCQDEPGVVFHHYNGLLEHSDFARVLISFASNEGTPPQQQFELLREAHDCYQAALRHLAALDEPTRRQLETNQSRTTLEAELAQCEAMMARFRNE